MIKIGRRIFLFFSFLILSAASVYCLSFLTGFALVDGDVNSKKGVTNIFKSDRDTAINFKLPFFSENSSQVSESTLQSSEITAGSDAKAKGKVIYKTIESSSANLKYQKIYIKNATSLTVDLKTELLTLPKLKILETSSPQVLIVHTHTTESYLSAERNYYTEADQTRTTNENKNIVAVGLVLKQTLESRGIGVIHATEKHDYPEYSGSYNRAAETIKTYLKKYPSIKVVIDLHRDSVTNKDGSKTALIKEVNGKKAAQLMIVSGCQSGSVSGFPNWRENFRLAIRLQQSMEVMYPGLARPMLFTPRKYNQHITNGSLLIECGTEANTLEQAKYSAELLGIALASTLDRLR